MSTKRIGRPTKFTEQLGDAICHGMANGLSLAAVCGELGVTPSTVFRWVREPDEVFKSFQHDYARAREAQGQYYGHRVAEIAEQCLAGEVDPQAARVAVDALKWTAGRMAPKHFGDRVEQHHTGTVDSGITIKLVTDVPDPVRPVSSLEQDGAPRLGVLPDTPDDHPADG